MAFGTRRILRRFITVTVWSVAVICVAWFLLSKTVPAASETVDDGRFEETHATSRTSLDQLLMSPDMFNEALAPNKKNHSVALVSMYLKSAEAMRSLTFENKQKYAEAQGYTFIDISSNKTLMAIVDTPEMQRNIYLLKTFVIAQVLEQGIFDWVMWCDADAIFLNHGKSLEQAGAIDDDFDLVLAGGHSMDWHWGKIVNSGHFTVKNSAWSKWFLQKLWNERPRTGAKCPGTIYNNLNNWLGFCWGEGEDIGYWLGEQGAIHALIRSSFYPTDFACHVKWVNMRDMNSEFPWYEDGDLIVHLPGKGNDERKKIFTEFFKQTDFSTGTVKQTPRIAGDVHDWRVRPQLFHDYRGAGWNVACRELYTL